MPDRHIDEETETRILWLCLFDFAGITDLNRCTNCPGAARAAIQHRGCLREHLQPNFFRPEDSDCKTTAALKSLASSSKQPDFWRHAADTVLPDKFARLSLDSDKTFGRSECDPDFPGGNAELSGTPPILHGVKHLSVEDSLKSKPEKLFRDLGSGNLYMPGCVRIPSDGMTALSNSSAASPMDTQEDRPLREISQRPFVPGCIMNTELDGTGLLPSNDGIATEGYEVLACFDGMEF